MTHGDLAPDLLEIATGTSLEREEESPRPRRPDRHGPSARVAIEKLVRSQMEAGPVTVSFSGGRDSSLVLAIACHVARRDGFDLPVPITNRHPDPESREDEWQSAVLTHLGVDDWIKVEVGESTDVLGADSAQLLREHGVLMPPNAYLHLPVVRAAGEATVLTGIGGDELLGTPGDRLAAVLAGKARPHPRDLAEAARAMAPKAMRRGWHRRKGFPWATWLTHDGEELVADRMAADAAASRLRWDAGAWRWARSRSVRMGRHAAEVVGSVYGSAVMSPLTLPSVVDAFAREVGSAGPVDRSWSMRHLARDLLPEGVMTRASKASFGAQIWGPRFRAFTQQWQAHDLPDDLAGLVDAAALLEAWRQPSPLYCSMALVQHLYLRDAASA